MKREREKEYSAGGEVLEADEVGEDLLLRRHQARIGLKSRPTFHPTINSRKYRLKAKT